jgi:transcriptional regulator with XRE-family HTH domain
VSGEPSRRARRADEIPADQAVIVGANIRLLRQRRGWSQARIGELMGWQSRSTVCAAEGRRDGRQRGFTTAEVELLAAIFAVSPSQLTTVCANCGGARQPGSAARDAEPTGTGGSEHASPEPGRTNQHDRQGR